MLAFSGEVRMWQPALVQSTEELCVEAVQWLNQLTTHGASSTQQALQVLEILTLLYIIIIITRLIGKPDNDWPVAAITNAKSASVVLVIFLFVTEAAFVSKQLVYPSSLHKCDCVMCLCSRQAVALEMLWVCI